MCLSIPAKILEINNQTARVSVRGTEIEISLFLLDGIKPGDYVLVHAGFALEKIDFKKAQDTLRLLDEMDKTK